MGRVILGCALVLGANFLVSGCASGPESRKPATYRTSAKENFMKGKVAFEDEDYLEAMEHFRFVKNKFPYSKFATEADLYIAETHFGRERYMEAADAYLNFIKLHPRHLKMPYAMFRIGHSFFNRIPEEWFITPPAYEMDQAETKRAIRELRRYLSRFPEHENSAEAEKYLQACLKRMAERAHYIMNFYFDKQRYRGALWRAEEILGKYSGVGFDEEALFRKGQALLQLKEPDQARASLQEMLRRFPDGDYANKARKLTAAPAKAAKPEPTKPEPTKPEPTKPEPTKPEPTKPEPTKPESTTPKPGAEAS